MEKPSKRNFIAEQLEELKENAFWEKYEKLDQDEKFNELFFREEIIKPKRHVWHVSHKANRESILKEGIKKRNCYRAVCVNNMKLDEFSVNRFWPLPIDKWDFIFNSSGKEDFLSKYDFWRIDTIKLDCEWRIDPFMRSDYKHYGLRSYWDYACTKDDIPSVAIEFIGLK
ncbi:MAG: hypothetical protein IPG89_11235 [Bacteroidetes bacterium]|nr:hypothetical protein [Bacteroidota bacterium]